MAPKSGPKDNGTPQAVDDILQVGCLASGVPHVIGTIEDLLANDRGGNGKNFYGFDINGAQSITIEGVGTIELQEGSLFFTPDPEWSGGEVSFDYVIQMGNNGVLSSASVSFSGELATLITFDQAGSLPYEQPILNGYSGLNWDNYWTLVEATYPGSGYDALAEGAGDRIAFNGWSEPSAVSISSSGADFDFLTGEFVAAWNNGLNVKITAFDDGAQVGTLEMVIDPSVVSVDFASQVVNGADSAIFTGTFASIDQILFESSGGTNAGLGGGGSHFATDNWQLCFETASTLF